MNLRPCIRGLREYKKGCPERSWNGKDGCPAWIEEQATVIEDGVAQKKMFKNCIDVWNLYIMKGLSRGLEGVQQATETFRNGMCEEVNGQVRPKINQVIVSMTKEIGNGNNDRQAGRLLED